MHTQSNKLINAYGMDCSNIPHPPLLLSSTVSEYESTVLDTWKYYFENLYNLNGELDIDGNF